MAREKGIVQEKIASVGTRIHRFRQHRRMTQGQLGLALGCKTAGSAKVTVAKIEGGMLPGSLRLGRIAEILRCSADILLSGTSRDLMEAIRCHVQPSHPLHGPSQGAFRVARSFLFVLIAQGKPSLNTELLEATNRLLYMAEHDEKACQRLFETGGEAGTDRLHQWLAAGDFRNLLEHLTRSGMDGAPPLGYKGYVRAQEFVRLVREHYVAPERPATSASGGTGEGRSGAPPLPALEVAVDALVVERPAAAGADPEYGLRVVATRRFAEGALLIRLSSDALRPLAKAGHLALTAGEERPPAAGEIVACWTRSRGFLCRRFSGREGAMALFAAVDPAQTDILRLPSDDIIAMRVVTGVLYE